MSRFRIAVFLLLASLPLLAAASAPVAEHRGSGPAAVSGVYSVTFNLNIASELPANSTIVCKAQIAPAGAAFPGFSQQVFAVPVESASSVAAVTGATATCTVEIPFSWTVQTARGVQLSYQIDAVNAGGALPAVVRTSSQQGIAQPYPASGGVSSLAFSVTF